MKSLRILALVALAALTAPAFAQVKISAMPAASTPLDGTEVVPAVQTGNNVIATVDDLSAAAITELTSANVISKWTGTCNSGTFLRADGSCQSAGGVVTGTFTVAWSGGCSASVDQDFAYTKIGNVVILTMLEGFTCTSNGASLTAATGQWPALLRPATADVATGPVAVIDSGTNGNFPGCIRIQPNGAVSIARTTSGGQWCGNSWTASGTKGISIDPLVFLGTNTAMYSLN